MRILTLISIFFSRFMILCTVSLQTETRITGDTQEQNRRCRDTLSHTTYLYHVIIRKYYDQNEIE